jgi:tRNA threonylcarbamoyladenosine biosynthesis protein TsaE
MGVGKTTLIKELSLQLGVTDIVSSPTFSIVNEYNSLSQGKIYHFDFYRLNYEKEAFDIGYEDYFFGDDYCFIEWPEMIPNLIEDDMVVVKIGLDGFKRVIEVII